MDFAVSEPSSGGVDARAPVSEPELLEMSLLLPAWQVAALDDLARSQGLTIGQMLRRVIAAVVTASRQSTSDRSSSH